MSLDPFYANVASVSDEALSSGVAVARLFSDRESRLVPEQRIREMEQEQAAREREIALGERYAL